jgi:anti-anti-sigma factor
MPHFRHFDVQVEDPVTIVKFTAPYLNDGNIHEIGSDLAGIADQLGTGELHLDFSQVTYLSSIVLAKLLNLHKRVTSDGGRFVLTNLDTLYDVFSVARLDKLLDLRRDNPDGGQPEGGQTAAPPA